MMAAVTRATSTSRCLKRCRHLTPSFTTSAKALSSTHKIPSEDTPIHTGQKWTADDYRLSRFVDKPKQVNERYAIKLVDEVPPTAVKGSSVYCNGGGGALGHPKVYINLDKPGNHACGYCGLRFFQDADHHHHH